MWNYTEEQWKQEVLSSLKKTEFPSFSKQILADTSIAPFSFGTQKSPFQQKSSNPSFLAIQNFDDLINSGMEEWIHHPDVGFRFRQLNDIQVDRIPENKTFFLSQPFPFVPNADQQAKIESLSQSGHRMHLGWSPLSFGLTRGEILKKPFKGWETIFKNPSLNDPSLTWFYLSSAPYQWAGAEPHMELGILLSLVHSTLTELDAVGVPTKTGLKQFSFGLALGTDVLVESSKICALKILWKRFTELVSEEGEEAPMAEVYVLPSLRYFSGRDPLNNLLRITLMALASGIGGANGFKCIPYDVLNQQKNSEALRVSTNIPLILKHEGQITQAAQALDGAPLFEETTRIICEKAWTFFQEIERKGGIFEVVRSGWLQMELKRLEEYSKNQLCYFQKELIGVNKYVARQRDSLPADSGSLLRLSDIIDPLFLTKSPDDYLTVEPLIVHSLCYEWDVVQMNSDRFFKKTGRSPKVKVVKGGGPVVDKKMTWLLQVLSIAGIEAETMSAEDALQFSTETPLLIMIPNQDEMEESLFAKIRPQILGRIWSFNNPKETSKIDKFLQVDVNALELIKEIQTLVLEGV